MRRKILLYIKPTERCNTDCLHCYNKIGNIKSDLSVSDYFLFIEGVTDFVRENNVNEVEIIFHGGEPTLYGIDNLKVLANITLSYLSFVDVKFSLQTNLLEVPEGLIDFAKKYTGGMIGTSYSPGLRFLRKGEYEKWLHNLQEVKSLLRPYLIITLSKSFVEKKNAEYLLSFLLENNICGFHFEPITKDGNASINWDSIVVDPQTYDDWKSKFTTLFIEHKGYQKIEHSEITRKAAVFVGGSFVGCSARNCYQKVFTLNADGTIGACPNKSKVEIFGRVGDKFSDIVNSKLRNILIKKERRVREECLLCDVFQYCNGGCVQVQSCYEGKKFYKVLMEKFYEDSEFRKWVESSMGTLVEANA